MAAAPPPPALDANPVTLKVMRLCKPTFHYGLGVPFPPVVNAAAADAEPEPGFALSGMLALPQSFGDIFLGETFSCYISLCNICPISLSMVGLKVEVQNQQQRETLKDTSVSESAIEHFTPQQTLDQIIEYELKDVGIHILICSALYTDSTGERKYFRKFFKFQVNNPLSMKSKTHALSSQNEVLVETQLQNAMPRQIFLDSVDFRPAKEFDVESLNAFPPSLVAPRLGAQPDGAVASASAASGAAAASAPATAAPGTAEMNVGLPPFGSLAYLKAGDTQQYMFRLRGKVPPSVLRQVSTLGRMDVTWRSAMGEAGRLQSNTVQRKLPPARGVEVSVVSAPPEVGLETPFTVSCQVTNTSQAEMQLQLNANVTGPSGGAILIDGLCTRNLGTFKSQASMPLELRLIAIEPGIHTISGLQLIDALTEQVHEVGTLADVLVRNTADEPVQVA